MTTDFLNKALNHGSFCKCNKRGGGETPQPSQQKGQGSGQEDNNEQNQDQQQNQENQDSQNSGEQGSQQQQDSRMLQELLSCKNAPPSQGQGSGQGQGLGSGSNPSTGSSKQSKNSNANQGSGSYNYGNQNFLDHVNFDKWFKKPIPEVDFKKLEGMTGNLQSGNWGGGLCYDQAAVDKCLQDPKVDRLAQIILSLIENECGNGIYESRRFDPEKVIVGILSKSIALSKCHREEMQRKRMMVFCDISGSCQVVCNEMAAVCLKIMAFDNRIMFCLHSNNSIWKIMGEGINNDSLEIAQIINDLETKNIEAYEENWGMLLRYLSIKTAVAFGDTDGLTLYRAVLRSEVELFYMGNSGVDSDSNNIMNIPTYILNYWELLPKAFFRGVDTSEILIEHILKYLLTNVKRD